MLFSGSFRDLFLGPKTSLSGAWRHMIVPVTFLALFPLSFFFSFFSLFFPSFSPSSPPPIHPSIHPSLHPSWGLNSQHRGQGSQARCPLFLLRTRGRGGRSWDAGPSVVPCAVLGMPCTLLSPLLELTLGIVSARLASGFAVALGLLSGRALQPWFPRCVESLASVVTSRIHTFFEGFPLPPAPTSCVPCPRGLQVPVWPPCPILRAYPSFPPHRLDGSRIRVFTVPRPC